MNPHGGAGSWSTCTSVLDGVADLGFPLSIHLEATYGVSAAAFETFAEMLAYWSPAEPGKPD